MVLKVDAVTDDIPELVRQLSDYIELAEGLGAVLTLALPGLSIADLLG